MKVLVTGSSGRFGPYVIRELESGGHELALFDLRKPLDEFAHWPWIEGNVTKYEDCEKAVAKGFDAVMHLAAQPWPTDHPRQQERRAREKLPINHTMQVNVVGTYNILHTAMLAGIKRFVMTSTNCVAGTTFRITKHPYSAKQLPIDEVQPSDIEDSYSFTKSVDEQLLEIYSRVYGMRTYGLRCAGLADEEMLSKRAANPSHAEGWDWGMWAYVARTDAANAHRLVLEKSDKLQPHDVFLCIADDTSTLTPSREIVEKFRPDLVPLMRSDFQGHDTFFSNKKLKKAVGWQPKAVWRK